MSAEPALWHGEEAGRPPRGVVFRACVRVGVLALVGVTALMLARGGEPLMAVARGCAALLALATCGWLVERAIGSAYEPPPPPEPPMLAPPADTVDTARVVGSDAE